MNKLLIQFILVINLCKLAYSGMKVTIDTRYAPESQLGGTDEQFAWRLKQYVETATQPWGYCKKVNPSYPITNQNMCGQNKNIGWIWRFDFDDDEDARYEIDFGTDFGRGSAIFVDGQYEDAFQKDFWWGRNWDSEGVFRMKYNFTAGNHTVLVIGQEFCCDGDMEVQFSRNEQPKKPLDPPNYDCQVNNECSSTEVECDEDEYQDGFLCLPCSHQCETCNEDPDQCYECADSENRLQIPDCECRDGYYDQEGVAECQGCPDTCKTCSSNQKCDTCEDDSFLDGKVCKKCDVVYFPQCAECDKDECFKCKNNENFLIPECKSTVCDADEYQVGNKCVPCSDSCVECASSTTCTKCRDDEFLLRGQCIKCDQQYGTKCGTCDIEKCLTCKNNPSFKLPDCEKDACDPGFTEQDNYCYSCELNCLECSDVDTCTRCRGGYYLEDADCHQCPSQCSDCDKDGCKSCDKNNYDLDSNCLECQEGYFKTDEGLCLSCEVFYGDFCGKCDKDKCLECKNNPLFLLPDCDSQQCKNQEYKDGNECKQCLDDCLECQNGSTCDRCEDLKFRNDLGQCQPCQSPCLLCTDESTCKLCDTIGFRAPDCRGCDDGFYMLNGECVKKCPEKQYGDRDTNECKQCDDSCFDCTGDAYFCTICPNEKFLYMGKCIDCKDIPGMEQEPGKPKGNCREICGDGFRLPDTVHQCDDGNNQNGDGCSGVCEREEGWLCGDGEDKKTICIDQRPIGYMVEYLIDELYLNIEEQSPIRCRLEFNKTFLIPEGTTVKDYVKVEIEGIDTSNFGIVVNPIQNQRMLQEQQNPLEYEIEINMDKTVKDREMLVSIFPRTAFTDQYGNTITESPPQNTGKVQEYYFYTEKERDNTAWFTFYMKIGVMCVMVFLPIYVFYYKNHFNRFYVLFFVIDIAQSLYFYRFLNVRWPINGVKFFRELRPTIVFYMWNFYEQNIEDSEFEKYSSGVDKFDREKESALFMNNAGALFTFFLTYLAVYFIVLVLSWRKWYRNPEENRFYNLLFQLRQGYIEWGIWFDSILASSGVFIIYALLQMTNPTADLKNTGVALFVAVFYFGFFLFTLRYVYKNKHQLYCVERNESVDGIGLKEKLKIATFKWRNIWHFINQLQDNPRKAYFYYYFVGRKVYLALVLLTLQFYPQIQLLMCSFSHLVVIYALLKFKVYKENSKTYELVLSEILVFIGVGCMYFLLDDQSEDEHFRLKYCWIVLGFLLLSLLIHGLCFIYNELLYPLFQFCLQKERKGKVVDLRHFRKEGKQAFTSSQMGNTFQDEMHSYDERARTLHDTNTSFTTAIKEQGQQKRNESRRMSAAVYGKLQKHRRQSLFSGNTTNSTKFSLESPPLQTYKQPNTASEFNQNQSLQSEVGSQQNIFIGSQTPNITSSSNNSIPHLRDGVNTPQGNNSQFPSYRGSRRYTRRQSARQPLKQKHPIFSLKDAGSVISEQSISSKYSIDDQGMEY